MARLNAMKKNEFSSDIEAIKDEIRQSFKKEEVTLIYDKYFQDSKITPTGYHVAEMMGYAKDGMITNARRFGVISWTVSAIRKAMDAFDKVEAAGNTLKSSDKLAMLDQAYDEKLYDIALNWTTTRKHNNK